MYDGATPFYPSPRLVTQYCSFHLGRVVKVGDPEGRLRVKVTVPGLLNKGKKNWTGWLERGGGLPVGGTHADGDEGFWKSLQAGQAVMVGFVSGHPNVMWLLPGPPCQKGKGSNKQLIPKEAKIVGKNNPRDATRLEIWKDQAGNTILMDSRGKKEKLAIMDWAGAGLFLTGPGKDEDEKDKDDEEDKPRKGKRRGTKNAAIGNTDKPSKLLRDGAHILALLGLMQAGIAQRVEDENGLWAAFMRGKDGKIAASILINSKLPRIYLTCGEAQWQLRGDKHDIAVTRQVIKELDQKAPVEDVIEQILELKKRDYQEFKEEEA